jgi:23S rRNA (adenine2030-N6)-methyltransferase
MNYRHAFHAGNFADVLKHIVLARILVHLKTKDAPFRVIDSHAGTGLYNLEGNEAQRTGEWQEGIALVTQKPPPPRVAELIAPWLALCDGLMAQNPPLYPGSPWIAADLTRAQDNLVFCEKHPEDVERLRRNFERSKRVKVMEGDAWKLLPGLLPPPERRGLVLIDPPFEAQAGEFELIQHALTDALVRWPNAIHAVWFPIKLRETILPFYRWLHTAAGDGGVLATELLLHPDNSPLRFNGCGVVIVNPPWHFEQYVEAFLPALRERLAQDTQGSFRIDWLKPAR